MFDENNRADEELSLHHCNARFGAYGTFSTMALIASAVTSGVHTEMTLEHALVISRLIPDHSIVQYIQSLEFDDKDFFSIDDYRFLIRIGEECRPRTEAELDADQRELLVESQRGLRMLRSHARILLKAVEFWRLRFNDKHREWRDKYASVMEKRRLEYNLKAGYISLSEASTGHLVSDDGYYSC